MAFPRTDTEELAYLAGEINTLEQTIARRRALGADQTAGGGLSSTKTALSTLKTELRDLKAQYIQCWERLNPGEDCPVRVYTPSQILNPQVDFDA